MAEKEQPAATKVKRQPAKPLGDTLRRSINNWTLADAHAIKAIQTGTASPEQQKQSLDWILKGACGLPDWPYEAGNHDETNINLGRHFVGHQIMKLLKADLSTVPRDKNADEHSE